jgi:hypothetical protein
MVAFTLDPAQVVQLVLTVFLPIGVGLVTTRTTKPAVKSWLLAGLTLATTVLTTLAQAIASHTAFDLGAALLLAVPAFAISVATYYGLWRPTGVAGAAQDVEATTLLS